MAARDLVEGEELTCNYNTFCYQIGSEELAIDNCTCSSQNCQKLIRGYKFLDENQRKNIEPFMRPFFIEQYRIYLQNGK